MARAQEAAGQASRGPGAGGPRRNVLFIVVDDLRPMLGCFGDQTVLSPNIDKLAARGTVFARTYCQQAVCAPSRNSVMTGLRPDSIGIYDLGTFFRTKVPNAVTLPQQFRLHGYHSEGMSKIYHVGHGNYDDKESWSVPSWRPGGGTVPIAPAAPKPTTTPAPRPAASQAPTGAPEVADNALSDGKTADHAIERLQALKDQPFFLAVGFLKPHLPFIAPKKYWDLYDPAKFELPKVRDLPEGAPRYAGNNAGELRTYAGVPKTGPISDDDARRLIHGYHACVSYTDAQIGRVLDELDRLHLRDNTIVVLWGDHGWHLGDHGMWAKHTDYEYATHSALIVSAPGQKAPGKRTEAITEFVDIYPTLCDLCDVPRPTAQTLEGLSFAPLLDDPTRPWKQAAYSQWPKKIPDQGEGMGHSVRTQRYRLTEWTVPGTDFSELELYDYELDPEETKNLAKLPEHANTVAELKSLLHAARQRMPTSNVP